MSGTTDTSVTDDKADVPPRRRRRATAAASSAAAGTSKVGGSGDASSPDPPRPTGGGRSLQSKLEEFFGSLAIPYATIGDTYAANLIAARAPALAEAWADLAKQNAGVRRVLERMLQGTAWGAVILSTASLVLPLLAHHGVLPLPVDPFSAMYGGESAIPRRGEAAGGMPGWSGAGPVVPDAPDNYMTPPYAEGEPPGVFTVAGSNSNAHMPPEAA